MKGQNGFSVVTCKFQIPKICEIKYSLEFKLGIENKHSETMQINILNTWLPTKNEPLEKLLSFKGTADDISCDTQNQSVTFPIYNGIHE